MAAKMQHGNEQRGNLWRFAAWGAATFLLLLPAIAMQFNADGVHWTALDFFVMGTMLFSACGAYELATRMSGNSAYRLASGIAIVAAFLLTWINLAVGIIGSEHNPANWVFIGVLVVAVIGAAIAVLRPAGMARAMIATAIAQALAGGYALLLGSIEGTALSGFFILAWLASALLFRKAQQA